jgi:uncharacterized protein (TIGR02996 family)
MSLEQAFLDDIVENLDDDTPRLVYADWLEENGREKTAQFIRLQVERARLDDWEPRAFALDEEIASVADHRPKAFLAPTWASEVEYRRGFPASALVGADQAEAVLADTARTTFDELTIAGTLPSPLDRWGFGEWTTAPQPWDWREVAAWPPLARIQRLRLPVYVPNPIIQHARTFSGPIHVVAPALAAVDDLATLLASPHLSGLRSLDLGTIPHRVRPQGHEVARGWWQTGSEGRTVAATLASCGILSRIEQLRLTGIWPGRTLSEHWEGPLSRLKSLDLLQTWLSADDLGRLAASGLFDGLRCLKTNSGLTPGVLAVLQGSRFASLRELDLSGSQLGRESLIEAVPPGFDCLASLTLDGNRFQPRDYEPIRLSTILPPGLRQLSLRGCGLGDSDAEDLARWPGMAGLTVLDLSENKFTKRGTWALSTSPHLDSIRRLALNVSGGPSEKELSRRFGSRWSRHSL